MSNTSSRTGLEEGNAPDLNIEDPSALLDYLRRRGVIARDETPVIRNLEGGVSSRVVLVKPATLRPFVLKQALEKLRVEVDWFCTPARMNREASALRYLSGIVPSGSMPAVIFQDSEQHLVAMEQIPEPHQNWKQMLLSGTLLRDHVQQFGLLVGTIHQESAKRSSELAKIFGDRSIFEALRVEPYYRYTASRVPESACFINQLIADTLACQISLVHGDYSPKNILVHDGKLALLDCEVVHFGDPAFDIGFSMAHFLSKANHLKRYRTDFAEAAVYYWTIYSNCLHVGSCLSELEVRAVRHTLACCLARVAGRSPLEYLSAEDRSSQAGAVLGLLTCPPRSIRDLVGEFVGRLPCQSLSA